MKRLAPVHDTVSVEEVLQAVQEAGHQAEIRMNDSGRRTLQCEIAGIRYAIQFYPNEGHERNAFGALRFVAWIQDDAPSPEAANAHNARFRFASIFAEEDCYEVQHDIIAVGVSDLNLVTCVQQWGTSLDDCMAFLAEA
ncbi:MAG: YbjN domain-containing protein [Acidobacteria bacterium]|nr:YbjN domain-containing protein [Acidobacteriota bacterium]